MALYKEENYQVLFDKINSYYTKEDLKQVTILLVLINLLKY